jgi:hypothetical protein
MPGRHSADGFARSARTRDCPAERSRRSRAGTSPRFPSSNPAGRIRRTLTFEYGANAATPRTRRQTLSPLFATSNRNMLSGAACFVLERNDAKRFNAGGSMKLNSCGSMSPC